MTKWDGARFWCGCGPAPKLYCREVNNENLGKWASIFCLSITSRNLQTADVRLMGLNRFGSAVLGDFATGVTTTWRQSSRTWEVWRERFNMLERVRLCRMALAKGPSGSAPLLEMGF